MGWKGDSAGGVIGFVINTVEEILEYGFVWNAVPADRTFEAPTQVLKPNEFRTLRAQGVWKDMLVDRSLALPVPVIYPSEPIMRGVWAWYKSSDITKCGPEGNSAFPIDAGDTQYLYNGPGAYQGQLLFKFGECGTPQPVWNEYSCKSIKEKGRLYLRFNTLPGFHPGGESIDVLIAVKAPGTQYVVKVSPDFGWQETDVERWEGWSFDSNNLRQAMPVPSIVNPNSYLTNAKFGPAGISLKEEAERYPGRLPAEGNGAYPYSGRGARYGQLLYKWGENGTVLPVLSGDYINTFGDDGNLFLATNLKVGDKGMASSGSNEGAVSLRVS